MSLTSKIKEQVKKTVKRNKKDKSGTSKLALDLKEAKEIIAKNENKLAIVFGANSALGIALVNRLLEKGRRVRIVVRNRFNAELFYQDKLVEVHKINYKNVIQVIKSVERNSIIYNCVEVPFFKWFKNYPVIIYNLIHAAKKKQAKLVHVDNLTVYGKMKTKSITERDPLLPDSDEGSMRKKISEQITIGHQRGEYNAVIIRIPDLYGPYIYNEFSRNVFENPLRKQKAKWFITLDKKHSLIYIKDAVEALIRIAEDSSSYGEIWNIPGSKPITGKEFIELVSKELDEKLKIGVKNRWAIKFESIFDAEMSKIEDNLEQWEYPLIIDGSKFRNTYPEFKFTTHKTAISETLEWHNIRIQRQSRKLRSWPLLGLYQPYRW